MSFGSSDDNFTLYEAGFEDDILNRAELGKGLSRIVEGVAEPLVIALDGPWGTGKTHFLKRWVGAHRKENDGKAVTLYFDAFESDYISDPIVALVAALTSRLPEASQPKLDRVRRFAMKLLRPAARVGLALATAGASVALDEVLDAGADALKEEAKHALEEFWKREAGRQVAMEEFRAAIHALTKGDDGTSSNPLVIVIDELDRCRPDFALDVLEVVKHFFSVANVHFILGVNIEALGSSVRMRYGSEIDSIAYLQKFISFSMTLPEDVGDAQSTRVVLKYASHLVNKIGLPDKFAADIIEQIGIVASTTQVSLRDVGKIVSMAALLPEDALKENVFLGWRVATVTLLIMRVVNPGIYKKLLSARISDTELAALFGASSECISETLEDGKYNPKFNRRVALCYDAWRYICRNGVSDGSDRWKQLGAIFDSFGRVHDAGSIPARIHTIWLSKFRIA
jgi:hypothetical protein